MGRRQKNITELLHQTRRRKSHRAWFVLRTPLYLTVSSRREQFLVILFLKAIHGNIFGGFNFILCDQYLF